MEHKARDESSDMRWKISLILLLMLAAGAFGEPAVEGTWVSRDVRFKDPDSRQPPRELKVTLSANGRAVLETAIVSRVYRMTTEGCMVSETRHDARMLEGLYEIEASRIRFRWAAMDETLSPFFIRDGETYAWPAVPGPYMDLDLPEVIVEFYKQ